MQQHFSAWNDVIAASWNYDIKSKIRLHPSIRIYSRNNPTKFHSGPIWNDRALGFFKDGRPNKKNNNKMSSDMRSVPDRKMNEQRVYVCAYYSRKGVKSSVWRAMPFSQNHWHLRPHSAHRPRTYVSSLCFSINGYMKYVPFPSPDPSSSGRTLDSQYGPKKAMPQATVARNRIRLPVTRAQRAITATVSFRRSDSPPDYILRSCRALNTPHNQSVWILIAA